MESSTYDVIEQIEAAGVTLEARHSFRGWSIKASGTLQPLHRLLLTTRRDGIIRLLATRQLAESRRDTAKALGLATVGVRASFADRLCGDELRSFNAGWSDTDCA